MLNFVCLFVCLSRRRVIAQVCRILGSGEFWSLDPLCIAVEGECVITLSTGSSMASALGLLLSVYYVFDIAYPAKASRVYFFCEMLIGIEQDARKRIAINIDYFMVGERVRFLFTSCEESETNERVFQRVSLRFFTTSE